MGKELQGLKIGQDVWLTKHYEYRVIHAVVAKITQNGYILRYDTGNELQISADMPNCFVSQRKAFDYLIRICSRTVEEARDELNVRRALLQELKQSKKTALQKIVKAR